MEQLLGENKLEERILRQLFLQRLPQNVQLILASSSDTVDLEQLAIIADKILEVASPPTVANSTEVNAISSSRSLEKRIDELQSQVSELTALVHGLVTNEQSTRNRDYSRGRSRERAKNRSTDKRRSPSKSKSIPRAGSECWYHWRFGEKAHV